MTNTQEVIYECPLNSLTKHALNFETLYKKLSNLTLKSSNNEFHFALKALIKLIALIDKPEIKSKYIQFYLKIEQKALNAISKKKYNPDKLDSHLTNIDQKLKILNKQASKFSIELLDEALLSTLYKKFINKGADEQQPSYFLQSWLNQLTENKLSDTSRWLSKLSVISEIILSKLTIIREFSIEQQYLIENGFIQLPIQNGAHLIRLAIARESHAYPEFCVGHHGISVQLLKLDYQKPSSQIHYKVPVRISISSH